MGDHQRILPVVCFASSYSEAFLFDATRESEKFDLLDLLSLRAVGSDFGLLGGVIHIILEFDPMSMTFETYRAFGNRGCLSICWCE